MSLLPCAYINIEFGKFVDLHCPIKRRRDSCQLSNRSSATTPSRHGQRWCCPCGCRGLACEPVVLQGEPSRCPHADRLCDALWRHVPDGVFPSGAPASQHRHHLVGGALLNLPIPPMSLTLLFLCAHVARLAVPQDRSSDPGPDDVPFLPRYLPVVGVPRVPYLDRTRLSRVSLIFLCIVWLLFKCYVVGRVNFLLSLCV